MKLSIITINLNNQDGLRKTIESVVSQSFTDFEYIVIDGGSTDGSIEIIKQYQEKITYWVSEPDKGIYNAMNKGILQAKGEYCLFLNSGDYLYNSKVLQLFFDNEVKEDIVYGKIANHIDYPSKLRFSFMLAWSLPHPAGFIKRDLFGKIGLYEESNKIISDWAFFMLAIYVYQCSYKHIPIIISVFDRGGISSSADAPQIIASEKKKFLTKYFPLFIEDYQERASAIDELNLIKHSRIYNFFVFFRTMLNKKILC
ncbi:MAG: glycosyltransferase [Candidatus Symbiothrix sp.]|jgi:glycosyltransferase involved in cell wall biosynthesis|nr:glycosyltransferase [Candidatus Symbiothrix sp.]